MKCTKSCGSINSYTAPFRMHYEANPLLHVFKGKKGTNVGQSNLHLVF